MKTIKRNPFALNLPQTVPQLIVYARRVILAMTNNAWFPQPTLALSQVTNDVDALVVAETQAQNGGKGMAAARDLKRKVVEDDLIALKAYAQGIANQHPEEALAIAASAGMAIRQYTRSPKPELAAVMGPAPGEVLLRAQAKRRAAYAWQWSGDGGKTWIELGTTTVANISVPGLVVGTTYLFRFRTTVKHTTGDWSQAITFMVH